MLIKTLRMENFRQFRGTTKVDFSCDSGKNVTIILGDNTFGKTTLLQAFNWCFYGKVNFDQRPDFLINYELSAEMRNGDQQLVEVEITVIHDGTEYVITTPGQHTLSIYTSADNGKYGSVAFGVGNIDSAKPVMGDIKAVKKEEAAAGAE